MRSPNLASISGYLCSLRRLQSFFIGIHDSLCRFLKLGSPISQNYASQFFWKKESKKNKQWFWDQNWDRKYSVVLKQSISKPVYSQRRYWTLKVEHTDFASMFIIYTVHVGRPTHMSMYLVWTTLKLFSYRLAVTLCF